jgi:hypothetical protein
MLNNYIYLCIIIFIFLVILIIYINNNQIEYFGCPQSRTGFTCNLNNNEFGICDSNDNCIPFIDYTSNTYGQVTQSGLTGQTVQTEETAQTEETEETQPDTCIKNQNFDAICKTFGSNYGVMSIDTKNCLNGYSEIICGPNYINGNQYNNAVTITPCMSKNIDFDDMCRYYNKSRIPNGYNINSLGANEILVGDYGDCYLNNGKPDYNSARAVCDYSSIKTLPKLERAYNKLDYNNFTDCNPINSNFNSLCPNNSSAIEIMGYDCLPGYGRAKCVDNSDVNNYNNSNNYSDYYTNTTSSSFGSCNC